MSFSGIISAASMLLLIIISLIIIFTVGMYNGRKDREQIPVEYINYVDVCYWKIDITGCIESLKDVEDMNTFNKDE